MFPTTREEDASFSLSLSGLVSEDSYTAGTEPSCLELGRLRPSSWCSFRLRGFTSLVLSTIHSVCRPGTAHARLLQPARWRFLRARGWVCRMSFCDINIVSGLGACHPRPVYVSSAVPMFFFPSLIIIIICKQLKC
jgi:hypothetical protein